MQVVAHDHISPTENPISLRQRTLSKFPAASHGSSSKPIENDEEEQTEKQSKKKTEQEKEMNPLCKSTLNQQ